MKSSGKKSVSQAVLDTGVDATHDALKGRVKKLAEFGFNGNTIKNGDASIAEDSGRHGTCDIRDALREL